MESMTMTTIPSALGAMNTGSMSMPTMASNASSASPMPTMPSMEGMDMSCRISMLWNWYTIDACFLSSTWHIRSRGMFAGSCIGTILLVLCLEFLRRMGREYDAFILRRARLQQKYSMTLAKQAQKKGTASNDNNRDCPCNCPQNDDPITTGPGMESSNAKFVGSNDVTSVAPEGVNSVDGDVAGHKNYDTLPPYRPSPFEQVIRALFHMVQFAVAYFIMLLAMYYNGYIIICIFIGAFLGALIFSWEPLSLSKENDACQVTKCCG